MYKIKFTSEHYVGTQRPIRLGLPIYPHTTPDICFCSVNNSDPVNTISIKPVEKTIPPNNLANPKASASVPDIAVNEP